MIVNVVLTKLKLTIAANILQNLDHDLAVAETTYGCSSQMNIEMSHNILSQLRIGIASEDHQAIVGHG